MRDELAYMVEAGLSPYEALHMGTVAPGKGLFDLDFPLNIHFNGLRLKLDLLYFI